ncbi:LysR substrate-binding domain-containing protein [Streptomyces sp. NPDC005820]|uniref:LysR substrate-binding domain-containing protein n=1 Tax=Streptomyces sp. NPDC005820 TaxID=3157069 RepID=UPI0033DD43AF
MSPWVTAPPGTACGRALARNSAQYAYTSSRAHTAREFPTALCLVRAGRGPSVAPTLALAGAPPETVALPTVPVAGHRRIPAVWPTSPSSPQSRTAAVVEALRQSAENLGLRPTP